MKQRNMKNLNLLLAFWKTGETQREFAQRIGLGYTTFNQIINGRILPRRNEMARIADGLGLQVDEIFPGNNESEQE